MDKVTADPVRAEADGVKGATLLRFILGMSVEVPQLILPVCKLALPTVLAQAVLSKGATQFSFIASGGGR